jgi:large subunit ribosomal protein L34e
MKQIKTPSGKNILRKLKRKPGKTICANCKKSLQGIITAIPSKIGKISKTEKTPSRMYGGYLCSKCAKELIREKARMI